MDLKTLVQSIRKIPPIEETIPDLTVKGIHFHSNEIKQGYIFVAIEGYKTDGHHFINDAIRSGAIAVIGEKEIIGLHVPYYRVENSRIALAQLAIAFYRNPALSHTIIGITGTNGKTTTSFMLRYIFEKAGIKCSLIGTVSHIINGMEEPSETTTPDALTLQKLLSKSNDPIVIIEVSSHALQQERLEGIVFDYALFTNLSHDHLNYHKDMNSYYEVKRKLFDKLNPAGEAIIANFNPWSSRLFDQLITEGRKVYSVGKATSDYFLIKEVSKDGDRLSCCIKEKEEAPITIKSPMQALHNLWNALLAYSAARRIGIGQKSAIEALHAFPGVPGRFETFDHPFGARVIIDYAHTPEAIELCLNYLSVRKRNKLYHIFGFRGDGDPTKRKKMVEITSRISDVYILTLDDLNGCSGEEMVGQYRELQEAYGKAHGKIIGDRTKAIQYAWEKARQGDCIFISGKGPERYKNLYSLPTNSDSETIYHLKELHKPIY